MVIIITWEHVQCVVPSVPMAGHTMPLNWLPLLIGATTSTDMKLECHYCCDWSFLSEDSWSQAIEWLILSAGIRVRVTLEGFDLSKISLNLVDFCIFVYLTNISIFLQCLGLLMVGQHHIHVHGCTMVTKPNWLVIMMIVTSCDWYWLIDIIILHLKSQLDAWICT